MTSSAADQTSHRKPYTRRTTAQWQSLIELYESSGQTQESFCREQGIAQSGLHAWRKRLNTSASTAETSSALIDITPQLNETKGTVLHAAPCQVELEIGGCIVRITTG